MINRCRIGLLNHCGFCFSRGDRFAGLGLGRTSKRIWTRPTSALAIVVKATSTATSISATAATWCLRALLGNQFVQLAVFEHLPQGPHGKAENGNGRAQIEGFLQGAGGAHFVIAQPDAETTAFSVATSTAALTAATRITPTAFGLPPLLLGVAVGITHGPLAWNQAQV